MAGNIFDSDEAVLRREVLDTEVLDSSESVTESAEILDDKDIIFDNGGIGNSQNIVRDFIFINRRKVYDREILSRQSNLKRNIEPKKYNELTSQEKLIIDLPIILVKLGWLYSAYCQLHWLESSGDDIEIPFEFVHSFQRSKDALEEMKNNFGEVEYASYDDYSNATGKVFKSGSSSYFLYDFGLDSAYSAYKKSIDFLETITNFQSHPFGNFNFGEAAPKMNYIRSIEIGDATGNSDDLGASLGRFSL